MSWSGPLRRIAVETGQTWIDDAPTLSPTTNLIDPAVITHTSSPVTLEDGTLCGAEPAPCPPDTKPRP